jgi:hypothetical protein
MSPLHPPPRPLRPGALILLCALLLPAGCRRTATPTPRADDAGDVVEATSAEVHAFCGSCHAYPPAESFPRAAWRREVEQGYIFYRLPSPGSRDMRRRGVKEPAMESVVAYYERRAPEELVWTPPETAATPCPVQFDPPIGLAVPDQPANPAVANVNLVHLSDDKKLDLLVCDMRTGRVMTMKPYEATPTWRVLAQLTNPCHTEVVDLDGDGIKDILVADLGNFTPTDAPKGRVVWLRGRSKGAFDPPVTLLQGVGRVTDVQAAEFRKGSGKKDLVVGVFGWRESGEIIFMKNETTDWAHPKFVHSVLDPRHGTIHICVANLHARKGRGGKPADGHGPDFVALISQEHETVVAFLNEGGGRFRQVTIYTGEHPAWGSTGIQVVDLDGDGLPDVLYTNGDILDQPYLVKPYHGIHWLRNRGTYPFEDHFLGAMPGVHRAVAADFQGKGRLDVVAVSFLPAEKFPERETLNLDAVIYLEQQAPGRFVRHSLETVTCDHATCAAGAWDGDGKVHLVTGNFCLTDQHSLPHSVALWKNGGPPGQ